MLVLGCCSESLASPSGWEGDAISEFGKVDRILSEFLGLLIAVVTGAAGYVLKTSADDLDATEDSTSQ